MATRIGLALGFIVCLAVLSFAACGPTELNCTPNTCSKGCCNASRTCVSGKDNGACGQSGLSCSACPSDQHCGAGACVAGAPMAGAITATASLPDVTWVVDKSGSMLSPIESTGSCPSGCGQGNPCPAGCSTRWGTIRTVLGAELTASATIARHSGVLFPTDNTCGVPTAFDVAPTAELEPDLPALTNRLISALDAAKPTGGTPTARSLQLLTGVAGFRTDERDHLVVLITDGVPNCNPMNPNTCDNAVTCRCTLNACAASTCSMGCLDEAAAGKSVSELSAAGARVLVVAVGLEVATTDAEKVLSHLAQSSIEKLSCPGGTNGECGPDNTCDTSTGRCSLPYYVMRRAISGSGGTSPDSVFGRIDARIRAATRCRYNLSDTTGATLIIDGVAHPRGDGWDIEGVSVARLSGATCNAVLAKPDAKVSFVAR